jgi:hypothetical protein
VTRTNARRTPAAAARSGSSSESRTTSAPSSEPLAGDPGRPGERQLAERRDVRADALLREQPEERHVRERLRPVDDERARGRAEEELRPLPQRLLAVDDERRPEALRQLRRRDPTHRQDTVPDGGRAREQC